ncbi:MAG: hypothetical protein CSB34_05055 [Desulfobulbus propionicus]|nr:MAG: hypothetical protein CSB34_05055 [Desulfobulbus propionicus]
MLNILRKQAQSFVIQAMVVLIAVVFIFWGVGSNLNNNRNAAATVNDVEIPFQDFQQSYERAADTYRQQFGGQVPEGFFDGIGLKNQVLSQLIQSELLRQGADEIGLMVSKKETQRRIEEMPVFQVDGHFDMDRYKAVLGQNHLTPISFEKDLQGDMLTSRVVEVIGSFAALPQNELKTWTDYSNTEVNIAYLTFTAKGYRDQVTVEDDELAAWYEKNNEQYKTDPQVKLQYLYFPFAADLDEVVLEEGQVAQYYEENKQHYQTPEQRRASHILFKVAESDSAERKAEQRKKAEDILQQLREGADFAALATEFSEGPSKTKGGDLGLFPRGAMVPAFDAAVFSMEKGALSEIVETPFGYHVIKLTEIQPATTKSLAEVRGAITSELKNKRVRGITFKKVSNAYEEIIRAGSLAKYVENGGENVAAADFFERKHPPAQLAKAGALLDVVFGLSKGELSSLTEVEDGYGIGFVEDIKAPEVPALEQVREQVVADYTQEKSVELARAAAYKKLAEVQAGADFATLEGVKKSGFIKRGGSAAGVAADVVQAAFDLKTVTGMGEDVIAQGDTFTLFDVTETRQSADKMDEMQQQQLADQLLANQQNRLVQSWVDRLRSDAKIWINEQLLQ